MGKDANKTSENLIEITLNIGNMACINCQNKIKNCLEGMNGVENVTVSYEKGTATFSYDEKIITLGEIEKSISALGYKVLWDEGPNYLRIVLLLAVIVALFFLLDYFGVLNLLVPSELANSSMGYGMLFVTGLITSVHCIAMCGGINLSQSLKGANSSQNGNNADTEKNNAEKLAEENAKKLPVENEEAKAGAESASKTKPHGINKFSHLLPTVLYNAGRVLSYTVIGGALGAVGMLFGLGSSVGVSSLLQGIVKLIAGVFMVIMGINMLNLAPPLKKLTLKMPKWLRAKTNSKKKSAKSPFIVGLLNGFMPCGPLQSMQLIALATANPLTGALSMLMFSLGTVPLMLCFGSIVATLGKKFTNIVMTVGAILVAVMGFSMLSQGANLSGLISENELYVIIVAFCVLCLILNIDAEIKIIKPTLSALLICVAAFTFTKIDSIIPSTATEGADTVSRVENGYQIVESELQSGTFPTIEVEAGTPVKWVITANESAINGCNYKMIINEYGIEHSFTEGENIITFTPTETGTFTYSCWMGMIEGEIVVT